MVTLYGPTDTLVPDGTTNPTVTVFTGTFNTGDVITCAWTSVTAPGGYAHNGWNVFVNSTVIASGATQTNPFPQGADSCSYTVPSAGSYSVKVNGGGGYVTALYLTAHAFQITASAFARCQYGTELLPTTSFVYYLTPGLIDAWLTADGLIWLAPLFTAFWFTSINAQTLCGAGPPALPVIDLSTLQASAQTLWQILQVIAWPNLCRCVTGSPAPNPYPAPAPAQPTGWPTAPTIGCSNADICTTLVALQAQVAAIQRAVGQDLGLTTLIQRYKLPFATITGAAHSAISGTGSFAVSRLIGMRVTITTPPAGGRTLGGNPPYLMDVGWMSIMTADDLIQEKRIAETHMSWLPELMADATVFGYFLKPGVVATFTELQAEP